MKKLFVLLIVFTSLCLLSTSSYSWVEDFSSDPFSNGWVTNNASRYFWSSSHHWLHTENYTNSGEWVTKDINYNGESFHLEFDVKPTDRNTGDVTFGLLGPTKATNSGTPEERVFVLVGGYSPPGIYLQIKNSGGEHIESNPRDDLMVAYEWRHIEIDYDSTSKTICIRVTKDNGATLLLDWCHTMNYGFSSNLQYLGVSMVGAWVTSGRYEAAEIDNISLFIGDPVAHWKFDGDATDSSGNGNDGTESGAPDYNDGVCEQAISLDGVDDYVLIQETSNLDGFDEFTASLWIKPAIELNVKFQFYSPPQFQFYSPLFLV